MLIEGIDWRALLSFAQFEREVTGERIRDKIAASKKKGRIRLELPLPAAAAKGEQMPRDWRLAL